MKRLAPVGQRSGFQLLEVLLALFLFSVVSLSVLMLFISSRTTQETGLSNLRATVVADVELEKWKSKPYTAVVASLGSLPVYQVVDEGVTYSVNTRLTRLSNVPTDTSYDLVDLRLEVEWQQKKALSSKDQQLSVGASTSRVVLHSTLSPSSPP